jgi:hypothetical protein
MKKAIEATKNATGKRTHVPYWSTTLQYFISLIYCKVSSQ